MPHRFVPGAAVLLLAAAAAARPCAEIYTEVPSIPQSPRLNALHAVTALAADDAWAVGWDGRQALHVHWDGTRWSTVAGPTLSGTWSLEGVSAAAADDVWAVGSSVGSGAAPLIEHWDGSAWSVVPAPSMPEAESRQLLGVAAVAPDDAWAVGSAWSAVQSVAFAWHWDGRAWSDVQLDLAGIAGTSQLRGVTLLPGGEAWAVGNLVEGGANQPLIEHWDGVAWRRQDLPGSGGVIEGVAALSASDAWAVGQVMAHWDGSTWSHVPCPWGFSGWVVLKSVSAACWSDVRAFGFVQDAASATSYTVVFRWDGSTWCSDFGPDGAVDVNEFRGSAAVPGGGGFWAVGKVGSIDCEYRTFTVRDPVTSTSCLQPAPCGTTGAVGGELRVTRLRAGGVHLDWTSGALAPELYNVHREASKRDLAPPASPPRATVTYVHTYDDASAPATGVVHYRVFGRLCDGTSILD